MANLTGNERARYVQGMFSRIAAHYDLMNRIMTFGQDRRWRQIVIQRANLPSGRSLLLDLGGGTGDLGFEALQQNPDTIPVEADFTLEMMRIGQQRTRNQSAQPLFWAAADALSLPFPENAFDAVVSGFLMRNVIDTFPALREQHRVLKPGGHIVILDTTRPRQSIITPLVRFHMHTIIPFLGRLIAKQPEAYTYLPDSSEAFLSAEKMAAQMAAAGFKSIAFQRLNFGTIAIHWGVKGANT